MDRGMSVLVRHGAEVWGLDPMELVGPCKSRRLSRPRQVIMWYALRRYGFSSTQAAVGLGNRDHTTILHGARLVDQLRDKNEAIRIYMGLFERHRPSVAAVSLVEPFPDAIPEALCLRPSQITVHYHVPPPVIRRTPALCATPLPGPVTITPANRMAAR